MNCIFHHAHIVKGYQAIMGAISSMGQKKLPSMISRFGSKCVLLGDIDYLNMVLPTVNDIF